MHSFQGSHYASADPGEGPGGAPLLFSDQSDYEARRAEKNIFETPPYLRVWMTARPFPYLEVWICHFYVPFFGFCERSR